MAGGTSGEDASSPIVQLIRCLDSAAFYNDKGFSWSGHGPDKVAEMRRDFQQSLETTAALIGDAALGPALSAAIRSGAVARDGSGEWGELARRHFGLNLEH